MAIYKVIEKDSGVVETYHRVKALHSIQFSDSGEARVEAYTEHYLDKEKRQEGKQPVGQPTRETFTLDEKSASLIKTIIYTQMRAQLEKFIDGSDIIEEHNYRIEDYLDWVSTDDIQAELDKRLHEERES